MTALQKTSAVPSFHFRFYVFEPIVIEEGKDRDPQTVAQLLHTLLCPLEVQDVTGYNHVRIWSGGQEITERDNRERPS